MRIYVTGGTGLIGITFCDLAGRTNEVYYSGLSTGWITRHATHVREDIVPNDLSGIDAVVHLAAITDPLCTDKEAIQKTNVMESLELFRRAEKAKVPIVVYASSASVYGRNPVPFRETDKPNPLCAYAASKALLDDWTQLRGGRTHYVGLRFSNIFGPFERHKGKCASMVFQLWEQCRKGNPRLYEWGEQTRDFLSAEDAAEAILLACRASRNEIINIGSGTATSFNAVSALVQQALGVQRETQFFPNPHAEQYQSQTLHDISKAKRVLEWSPRHSLEEGLARTIRVLERLATN